MIIHKITSITKKVNVSANTSQLNDISQYMSGFRHVEPWAAFMLFLLILNIMFKTSNNGLSLHFFMKYMEAQWLWRPLGNCPACPFLNLAVFSMGLNHPPPPLLPYPLPFLSPPWIARPSAFQLKEIMLKSDKYDTHILWLTVSGYELFECPS